MAGQTVICSVSVVKKRQFFFPLYSIGMREGKKNNIHTPKQSQMNQPTHQIRIIVTLIESKHSTPISNGNTIWHINWTLCTHHKRTYAIGSVFAQSITQPFWMLTIAWFAPNINDFPHCNFPAVCKTFFCWWFRCWMQLPSFVWIFKCKIQLQQLWIWILAVVYECDHNLRRFYKKFVDLIGNSFDWKIIYPVTWDNLHF